MAKAAVVAKVRPVGANRTRAEEDAYFKALAAASEERQRNETPEQQVERWNQEAYSRHIISEYEADLRRARAVRKSKLGNHIRQMLADRRGVEIVRLWPEACRLYPRGGGTRYEWIVERLKELKLEVDQDYLVNVLIPALRSQLVPSY